MKFYFLTMTLTVAGLLIHFPAFAQEGPHTRIHHLYQSNRALGMGDAFVAIADDYSALFYNPAGLARRDSGQINASIEVGLSSKFMKFTKDVDDIGKRDFANDDEEFEAYSELLQEYYGETFMFRTGLFHAIWARENWAIGFLPMDLTLEYKVHNQVAPALNLRAYADTTLAYGYGKDLPGLVPGRLSWGTTVKFVNRGYVNKQVNALDMVADSEVFKKEELRDGYTIDFDLGALYTPDIPGEGFWSVFQLARPTFGAVVRNALDYGFGQSFKLLNKEGTSEPPEKLHRVLDVGAKFEYPDIWIFGGRGAIDFRDLGHPNLSMRKSLHIGFEFDWTVSSWWKGHYRVGFNQGYLTAGVSALLFVFNLDALTYAEDVGTFNNPKENRVYAIKLNFDW